MPLEYLVDFEELKQEAARYIKKDKLGQLHQISAHDWIIYFFNIEKSDLESKEEGE